MEHDGGGEKDAGEQEAPVEDEKNGPENEDRGDGARVQILIEDIERGAGDGEGEEHADQSNAGPLSGRGGKAAAGEGPARP